MMPPTQLLMSGKPRPPLRGPHNAPVQARRATPAVNPPGAARPPAPATGSSGDEMTCVCDRCSGGDLHGRVEINLPRCVARYYSTLTGSRRPNPIGPHATEMQLDRCLDTAEGRIDRLAHPHAPPLIPVL